MGRLLTIGHWSWFNPKGIGICVPFYHPDLSASSFQSVEGHNISCTVSGPAYCPHHGRRFTGSNHHIDMSIPDEYRISTNNPGTIIFWIKYDARASELGRGIELFTYWLAHLSVNNYPYFGGTNDFFVFVPTKDVWYHIALIINGQTDKAKLYYRSLGGTRVMKNCSVQAGPNDINLFPNRIGNAYSSIRGKIGEFRIYARILTDDEIERDYEVSKWRYEA